MSGNRRICKNSNMRRLGKEIKSNLFNIQRPGCFMKRFEKTRLSIVSWLRPRISQISARQDYIIVFSISIEQGPDIWYYSKIYWINTNKSRQFIWQQRVIISIKKKKKQASRLVSTNLVSYFGLNIKSHSSYT